MIKPAAYGEHLAEGKVICHLCPAECLLTPDKKGICRSRFNQDGKLVTDNYGELVTVAVDPIEKKPLYHFFPGADILSTGPNSCNLSCEHCQNWAISQRETTTRYCSPAQLVDLARECHSIGVAFTYTEPLMWFEYIMDTTPLLKRAGLKTVLVSNGYINAEPLEELVMHIDAINIDLKSMREQFYKRVCKGRLDAVLHAIRRTAEAGVHLEVTNLVIPGLNDSDEELSELADFLASVSRRIPLHFSAYRPDYKMDRPPTPVATLVRAKEIAMQRLQYVYLGNVMLPGSSDTHCPGCGRLLISRNGYRTSVVGLSDGGCVDCGNKSGIIR